MHIQAGKIRERGGGSDDPLDHQNISTGLLRELLLQPGLNFSGGLLKPPLPIIWADPRWS